MDLYIEKEFLDNFYLDFNGNQIQERLKVLFTKYGSKRVFIDFKADDFLEIEENNMIFAEITSNDISPIPVESIKQHLFDNSDFTQTLVFTNEVNKWFYEAERKGAWCFSFENYQDKIKSLIDKIHFKVDLSNEFNNWSVIDISQIPFNHIQITDGYILKDEKNIKENLIPLIASFVNTKKEKITIDLLIKEVGSKTVTEEKKKDFAAKQHQKLNSKFSKSINLNIYLSNLISNIDLHDRTVITNFSILDSGVGFSLVGRKVSNSQMVSESIFEKYTYDRLRGLKAAQQKYIDKLNGDSFDSVKFYKYP
mgnify:CR=1 FL=1